MGSRKKEEATVASTFAPARNFTIPLSARVRAAAGPPACAVRKRRIEDLEAKLVGVLCDAIRGAPEAEEARRGLEQDRWVTRALRELGDLITAHNRYYVIEANLPLDPKTGALLERGRPWQPLSPTSFAALFEKAAGIVEREQEA